MNSNIFVEWMTKLEVAAWNKIYQRRDQDPAAMTIFHQAEEELEKKFAVAPYFFT
jgi:hypothetical protein